MKKNFYNIFTAVLMLAGSTELTNAQSGMLDNTFDADGMVTTGITFNEDFASALAIQSDGRIIAAGESDGGTTSDFALIRYNIDGSLDTTFGAEGIVVTDFAGDEDNVYSIAIQSDGKIIVGGKTFNGTYENFALARYNPDGTLDNTFGTAGKAVTDFGDGFGSCILSLKIQSDNKIVVGGVKYSFSNSDFAIARYNSDGTLDNTFGSGGKLVTSIGSFYDNCQAITLQSDGKIIAVGYSEDAVPLAYFAVVRYNTDGSLDNTFGTSGITTTLLGSESNGSAYSVAIQTDGKIVVGGINNNGSDIDFAVARYNTNGILDNTFGTSGISTTDFANDDDESFAMTLQSDGKIVLAGYTKINYGDFALVRYNTDGTLDNTFDTDGRVSTNFGVIERSSSVAMQADGKIVAAGYSSNGSIQQFAVARYFGTITDISSQVETNAVFSINPNPFKNELIINVRLNNFVNISLDIFDATGKLVYSEILTASTQRINTDFLTHGVYAYKLSSDEVIVGTGKLIHE